MKKTLLIILLLASIFYLITSRYDFVSGHAPDGTYTLVMVNATSGKTVQLVGK